MTDTIASTTSDNTSPSLDSLLYKNKPSEIENKEPDLDTLLYGSKEKAPKIEDTYKPGILSTYGQTIKQGVKQVPGYVAQMIEGATPYSGEANTLDETIENAKKSQQQFENRPGKETPYLGGLVNAGDIRQAAPSMASSAGGLLPTLAGAGAGALAGSAVGPIGTVAGGLAGAVGGYMGMKRASENATIRAMIDQENAKRAETGQKPLSIMEKRAIQDQANESGEVSKIGHGEALGETAGNLLELGLMRTPIGGAAKALLPTHAIGKALTVGAGKALGTLGTEVGTETLTQQMQHNPQVKLGLEQGPERSMASPEDWATSLKEVAKPTILATLPMAGLGGGVGAYQGYKSNKDEQAPIPEVQPEANPAQARTQELQSTLGAAKEQADAEGKPSVATTAALGHLANGTANLGLETKETTPTPDKTTIKNKESQQAEQPAKQEPEDFNAWATDWVNRFAASKGTKNKPIHDALRAELQAKAESLGMNTKGSKVGELVDAIKTALPTKPTVENTGKAIKEEELPPPGINPDTGEIFPSALHEFAHNLAVSSDEDILNLAKSPLNAQRQAILDNELNRRNLENPNAQQIPRTGETNVSRSAQPGIREEGRITAISGTGLPSSRQESRNIQTPPQKEQIENGKSENQTPEERPLTERQTEQLAPIAQAATRQPEVTEAQKEAETYPTTGADFQGVHVSTETAAGQERKGIDENGKPWSVKMQDNYGFIPNIPGADKDHIDVFTPKDITPEQEANTKSAFIVDQINPKTGKFDEHKIMLGYPDEKSAKKAYLRNYSKGWKGLGSVTEMPMAEFKDWLHSGETTKSLAYDNQTELAEFEPTISEEDIAEHQENPLFSRPAKERIERRKNPQLRKAYDVYTDKANYRRTIAENKALREKLYTNPLSEVPNKIAFTEGKVSPVVASIDLDALKFINDNVGHAAGDDLLKLAAKVLKKHVDIYHVSGDEYWAKGQSAEQLDNGLKAALAELESGQHVLESEKARFNRPSFSYGISSTEGLTGSNEQVLKTAIANADEKLLAQKSEREQMGQRAGRGEVPQGYTRKINAKVAANPFASPEETKQAAITAFGEGINRLSKVGVLNFIRNSKELPSEITDKHGAAIQGNEEAIYADKKIYVFTDSLEKDRLNSVLLHEIGEHFGLKAMLGLKGYYDLQQQIKHRAQINGSQAQKVWKQVEKAYPEMKVGSDPFIAEVIAKLGETGSTQPWYKRLIIQIKAFLMRHGLARGIVAGSISDADLHGLLIASLHSSAREQNINKVQSYPTGALMASLPSLPSLPFEENEGIRYSRRVKPDPRKTVIAYKLFRIDKKQPGKLFPLFVNAKTPVEIGTWEDADIGESAGTEAKNGRTGKVKSSIGPLAYRPGWHSGSTPLSTHIGGNRVNGKPTTRENDTVWAEVEVPADIDWQSEANSRASIVKSGPNKGQLNKSEAHITDKIPEDGYYRYKTNSSMTGDWLISGAIKVNRVLSDEEVKSINDKIGVSDLPRTTPIDLKSLGFKDAVSEVLMASRPAEASEQTPTEQDTNAISKQEWVEGLQRQVRKMSDRVASQKYAVLSVGNLIEVGSDVLRNLPEYSVAAKARSAVVARLNIDASRLTNKMRELPKIMRRKFFTLQQESTLNDIDASRSWTGIQTASKENPFSQVGTDAIGFGGHYRAYTQAKFSEQFSELIKQAAPNAVLTNGNSAYFKTEVEAHAFLPVLESFETQQATKKQEENKARKEKLNQANKTYSELSESAKKSYTDSHTFLQRIFNDRLNALQNEIDQSIIDKNKARELKAALRLKFESNSMQNYYAPLERFGSYWFYAADKNDVPIYRMFESKADRDIELEKYLKADSGNKFVGKGESIGDLVKNHLGGADPAFILKVQQIIKDAKITDKTEANRIQDEVYQMYLAEMPDVSMRHHAQNRKGIAGYELDQARSFAHVAHHSASQLANMLHGKEMAGVIKMATDIKNLAEMPSRFAKAELQLEAAKTIGPITEDTLRNLEASLTTAEEVNKPLINAKIALLKKYADSNPEVIQDGINHFRMDQERLVGYTKGTSPADTSKMAKLITELQKAYDFVMNPGGSDMDQVAGFARQLGFVFNLGFSISGGLVNLLQTPGVAAPVIAGQHGFGATIGAINTATQEFAKSALNLFHKDANGNYDNRDSDGNASISVDLENRLKNINLSQDEKEKLEDALEFLNERKSDNTISSTQTMDVIGIGKEGSNYGGTMHDLANLMGMPFHHGERMNREVTLMAAFRLARAKNLKGGMERHEANEAAAQYALWANERAHFNYDPADAARIFRGWPAQLMLQFKKYPRAMMFLWAKSASDMIKGYKEGATPEQKEEGREAARTLGALALTQVAFAGVFGMPMVGIAASLLNIIGGAVDDDDEPFDIEKETRVKLTELGGEAFATAIIKGAFNASTPINLSSRMDLSDPFLRPPEQGTEGKDLAMHYLEQVAGPSGGILVRLATMGQRLGDGEVLRAAEHALPKAFGDLIKAYRFQTEGAQTLHHEMIKEMSPAEVFAQALGFSSSGLEVKQTFKAYAKQSEKFIRERRQDLENKYVLAKERGDDLPDEEIGDWNDRHPQWPITRDNLMKSKKTREKHLKEVEEHGFSLNHKLMYLYERYNSGLED